MEAFVKFNKALEEVCLLLKETQNAFEEAQNSKTAVEKAEFLFKANTFSRSGIVLLCGHFEGFLKALLNEFAGEINNAKVQPEFVPASLLETVLEIMLKRCNSSETHRQKLQDLVAGKTQIEMDADTFSYTGGNPKIEVIEKMLDRIGITDAIETLSMRDFGVTTHARRSQIDAAFTARLKGVFSAIPIATPHASQIEAEVIKVVEGKWMPKSIRRDVGYVATIQELLKKRNLIAHGEGYPKVTAVELERFINEIKVLALGLDQMIHKQLTVLCGSATKS